MQKITPNLWFDTNAQEAVDFYTSVFNGGAIVNTTYYPEAGQEVHGMQAGTILTIDFMIEGMRFTALNGGPVFSFTPAISFMVNFDPSQDAAAKTRLDQVWGRLSEGGKALMPLDTYPFSEHYGWIQDRFGVSWQLILTKPSGEKRPVIIPSLMFTGDVAGKTKEATDFYMSVFKDSKRGTIAYYGAGMEPDKEGTVMFTDFQLQDTWLAAMDSAHAHAFTFNEAVSLVITCKDQEEIDHYWNALSAVPESEQCGWLKDKYGVSWQVVAEGMENMLNDPNKEKANRAMNAMLQMKKIDIAKMQEAFRG